MKPEQYNVEDLFRSAFEDASLEPPHKEDMWAAIQSAVQHSPTPVIPIFRTNRFKVSIAASVVLLLGFFYYFGKNETVISSKQVADKLAIEEVKENTQNTEKQGHTVGKKEEVGLADNSKQGRASNEAENSVLNTETIKSAPSEITTDANTTLKEEIKLQGVRCQLS